MTKLEKVLKELRWLQFNFPWQDNPENDADKMSNAIHKYTGDAIELLEDALELLKEQEARVIRRDELKQFEGSPCWFESHGTYMGKEGFWIIPAMFRTFFAGTTMSYTSVLNGMGDYGELGLSAYNKAWRCWTARPTDEQREAVKWK